MRKPRVAINGFGRIGRQLLRVLLKRGNVDVVAINDVAEIDTMAHLFRYDSVHGKWVGNWSASGDCFHAGSAVIRYCRQSSPGSIPWKELEIDVVVECTGKFKSSAELFGHIEAGAKKVLVSAPTDGVPMIIPGVNTDIVDLSGSLLSCASCTTNSAAPLIQLLDELAVIESCYVTTVHSYTLDQRLQDAPHKDLRRARAAAQSIVPTSTGAAKALTVVFPHLAGRIGGCGIRVPVPDGSLTDLTAMVLRDVSVEEINNAFREASEGKFYGIVEYTEDPVVSRDIIGNSHSCVFDSALTSVIGKMVKIVGWYDNEAGYSNRLADTIILIAGRG